MANVVKHVIVSLVAVTFIACAGPSEPDISAATTIGSAVDVKLLEGRSDCVEVKSDVPNLSGRLCPDMVDSNALFVVTQGNVGVLFLRQPMSLLESDEYVIRQHIGSYWLVESEVAQAVLGLAVSVLDGGRTMTCVQRDVLAPLHCAPS